MLAACWLLQKMVLTVVLQVARRQVQAHVRHLGFVHLGQANFLSQFFAVCFVTAIVLKLNVQVE